MEIKEIIVSIMTLGVFWGIAYLALNSVRRMDKNKNVKAWCYFLFVTLYKKLKISATALYKFGGISWSISTLLKISIKSGSSLIGISCSRAREIILFAISPEPVARTFGALFFSRL